MRAGEIAERLGCGRVRFGRAEWRGRCPACGYADALVLSERGGLPRWWCASCQDGPAVTAAIRAAMGEADWTPPVAVRFGAGTAKSAANRTNRALALWDAGAAIEGTPAERYLAARGLLQAWRDLPGRTAPALRYHPRCRHPCGDGMHLPAMLALVHDVVTGRAVAVHRTYLRPDGGGKADVEPAKASLGPVHGGAVMLAPLSPSAPLVIAEGIETALAAGRFLGGPPWAAISAGNMGGLAVPAGGECAVIAADPDPPGQRAAWELAKRWHALGRRARVATPDDPERDFADLLSERVAAGEVSHG